MNIRDINNRPIRFNPNAMMKSKMTENNTTVASSREVLREFYEIKLTPELIKEAKENPNSTLSVQCLLQRAGAKNQNGRVYPKAVLEREAAKYVENFVKNRTSLGQLDHPDSQVVELAKSCLLVTKMWWDGDDLMGLIEVLHTPSGQILRTLLLSNVGVGISSRGLGTVSKKTTNEGVVDEVSNDFELIAFDAVSNPSVQGAYMNREPLHENKVIQETESKPLISMEDAWNLYKHDYNYLLARKRGQLEDQLREAFFNKQIIF